VSPESPPLLFFFFFLLSFAAEEGKEGEGALATEGARGGDGARGEEEEEEAEEETARLRFLSGKILGDDEGDEEKEVRGMERRVDVLFPLFPVACWTLRSSSLSFSPDRSSTRQGRNPARG
jgi:hypothetical protein